MAKKKGIIENAISSVKKTNKAINKAGKKLDNFLEDKPKKKKKTSYD